MKLFESAQAADGGYEYDPFRDKKRGEAGRTGAAVFAMALLDRRNSPAFNRAVEYLKANLVQVPDGHSSPPMHVMSAALALAACGDGNAFMTSLGRQVQGAQNADGSFKPVVGEKTKKLEERRSKPDDKPSGKDDPMLVTAYHLIALKAPSLKLLIK